MDFISDLVKINNERSPVLNQFYCLHPTVFGVVDNIAGINPTDTALTFLLSRLFAN